MARRGSAMGALPAPSRASQVRSTPVMSPERSVTALAVENLNKRFGGGLTLRK